MSIHRETSGLVEQVTEALRRVIDPELGENIVDLGMVYEVTVVAGAGAGAGNGDGDGGGDGDRGGEGVLVRMTTTTPGCPATGYLTEGVLDCAAEVPGVASVDVELTYEPPWTPDMMSEAIKERFGVRD